MANECRYNRFCKFPGKICTSGDENTCTEALILCEKICPVMAATNVPKENCGCDISHIKELWPANKKCFSGTECLPRRYPVVQRQIFAITDRASIIAAFTAKGRLCDLVQATA